MRWLARLNHFGKSLLRRERLDRELDEELAAFADDLTQKKMLAGMRPDEARRAAWRELGNTQSLRSDVHESWAGHSTQLILHDLYYAWRCFWRAPSFAIASIVTLAIGIGASTAIFAIVDAMLLRELPFRDASRLVFVWSDMSDAGYPRAPLSGPELKDLRERGTSFSGFGAIWANTVALTGKGDPEQLRIGRVTTDFFSVLGAEAVLGRTFSKEDDSTSGAHSILLSWPVWQRRFGSDRGIVGRRIEVNGQPITVIGVMPENFRLMLPPDSAVPDDLQAWLPFDPRVVYGPRGQQYLRVVGRLKPGASVEQGRQEVASIAAQISREFSEYGSAGRVLNMVPLQGDDVRELRPVLLALFGGVMILLLIAWVNVGSLLIARAVARRREMAVRLALGARTSQLFRQCLLEGMVVALVGAVAGIAVARAGLRLLLALRPASLDRIAVASISPRVLLFTAGAAMIWGVLLSLAPLREAMRRDLLEVLQQDTRVASGRQRARSVLVVAQIALSLVLAVSAGLTVRTFSHLLRLNPGFDASSSLSFRLALPGSRYGKAEVFDSFSRDLEARIAALPGVSSVGAVSHLPYDNIPNWGGPYSPETKFDESNASEADYRAVSPGFFQTVNVPLTEGRGFTEADDTKAPLVVVVDELLARKLWPGRSPLGQKLMVDPFSEGHPKSQATVIGVVRHLRLRSLTEELIVQVYFAQRQILRNPVAYVVRSRGDLTALAPQLRQVIAGMDGRLPIYDVRPLAGYLTDARAGRQFTMVLAITFATIALTLAAVGIYGVMTYSVNRRRYEFGIRMALGARPGQVVGLVLREGVILTGFGIVLGLGGAGWAAHALRALLFGVTARDPLCYAGTVAILGTVALLSCWLPARRASTRGNISSILRSE